MTVDRCICCNTTFEQLLAQAKRRDKTITEVCKSSGCGSRCKLCLPYLIRAFQTNCPRVPLMSEIEAAKVVSEARIDLAETGS